MHLKMEIANQAESDQKCLIYDIKKYAIHDGPGIRTTVFLKGCPLSCRWCHNPEGISPQKQVVYHYNRCLGCLECIATCKQGALNHTAVGIDIDPALCITCGDCVKNCPSNALEMVGCRKSVADIIALVKKDLLFYDSSGGGVTFSGGEPLLQWPVLLHLLDECQKLDIHTAVDTSGYAKWDVLDKIAARTDLFLYDVKVMDDPKHRLYTGVSNKPILANLERLSRINKPVIIRVPLISGVNADQENIEKVGGFLSKLKNIQQIDILPYHDFHLSKYQKFNLPLHGKKLRTPSANEIAEAVAMLGRWGLNVNVS